MSDDRNDAIQQHEAGYEPPAIDERTQIDTPLIGVGSGGASAAFHPEASDYEPPAIDERTTIDTPLVATGGGSTVTCMAVHP